jgi:hypothetical protein
MYEKIKDIFYQAVMTHTVMRRLENWLTDGGEVVSLTRRPADLYPRKIPGTHLC